MRMMKKILLMVLCAALAFSCTEKEPENIPGRGDWTEETPDNGDDKEDDGDDSGNGDKPGEGDNTGDNNGGDSGDNGDNTGDNNGDNNDGADDIKPTVVTPTVDLGNASDDYTSLKLTPGKLVGFNQVTVAVCNRAKAAGMYIDAMLSDGTVFNITPEELEALFVSANDALETTGVDFWGVHLPYKDSVKLQYADEAKRLMSVKRQINLMELSMKYLKPQHFVVHPGSGNYYTHETERFATAKSQCRKSLIEMQAALDRLNAQYGTNTILCVENCARTVAYDAESLLDLLSAPGLEKTRICLDAGHAQMPMNDKWRDPETGKATMETDVVAMLKTIGTRLGTLHIQQNHGAAGKKSPTDEHIVPWTGGLIDWGAFYEVLLKNCLYRGCFLYEVTYETEHNGAKASIESCKSNYEKVIYPAFREHLKK